MVINYVTGDATEPVGDGTKVIVHCCNNEGIWGAGFVMALSARWPEPEAMYRAWHRDGGRVYDGGIPFALGQVQLVSVEHGIFVANLIGQQGIDHTAGPPVRYWAIHQGLANLGEIIKLSQLNASVHMPRIGCGLAGGSWDEIEPLILNAFIYRGIPVTVYDLP